MCVELDANVPVGILLQILSGILLTSEIKFVLIILNCLSVVLVFAVALKVNVSVVSAETFAAVPVIAPELEFNENPAPDKTEVVSE